MEKSAAPLACLVCREAHMSSEQYRGFAKDCLRWAEETISEEDHQHFIAMAKAWMHAAAELSEVSETVGMSGKAEPKRKAARW